MYRILGADGKEYGPISADQLREWIAQNRANATTPVLVEGATEWHPLSTIPEFAAFFTATSAVFPPGSSFSQPATNAFAITGLILGIVSLTAGLCCCYGLPFSVTGLVFSLIALGQIRSQPERYKGTGMAITGIVLCCLSLALMLILMLLGVAGAIFDHSPHNVYKL